MSSLQNQTNVIPKVLYGQSEVSGSEVSMNISSTGIILGGDLNTANPITATISQAGIITDNPDGFNILSSLNLNGNGITNTTGINTSGSNIDIIAQTHDINLQSTTGMSLVVNNGALNLTTSGAGINLLTDADINITSATEINIINPTDTFFNLSAANTGDGIVYGNFYGNLSGIASSSNTSAITDNNTSATYYPVFVSNNTGNLPLNVDKTTNPLSYNPSTGNLTSTLFTGLLSTGGLVYLSTGSASITGSPSATSFSLSSIFNSTYKNYRIVIAPSTQVGFVAYPAYSLTAFLGTGAPVPTFASLYGFEISSSASTVVSAVYTAGAAIASTPLILAVSQSVNHQTIIEIENVGYSATATQAIGLKCKSFYGNPGISGASDRSIVATYSTGTTITGLTLQQSSISAGNNMTIGWTIYAYK
jgi:hypothetical protein